MERQKRIETRWTDINKLFVVLVLFILAVLIIREYQTFRDNINIYNESSFEMATHEIQHEVDNRVEEISSVQEEVNQDFKDSMKQEVLDVDFFASEMLEMLDESATLEERRNIYINAIYEYDIQEEHYLFFAIDLNGNAYLSALTKYLEGTNILNMQDEITGVYFVQEMIDLINYSEDREGYTTYFWPKQENGEHLEKTSFIHYNEEVELFIGTGVYKDDYVQTVQNELFRRISSYYHGPYDYIYVFDYEGNIIFYPNEDFTQQDLMSIKTVSGEQFHGYIVDALREQDSVFIDYTFDFNEQNTQKTGYIRKIEDWNMYFGRSFVFDDLRIEQEQYLQSVIWDYLIFNGIVFVVLLLLVIVLKRKIKLNFSDVRDEFRSQQKLIKEASYKDNLTGLYTRSYFDIAIKQYDYGNREIIVLMIDVNGLKLINDTYGHHLGDELLLKLTQIIREVFEDAIHFRWGGDEFIVLCNFRNKKEMQLLIEEFHNVSSKRNVKNFTISSAVGYAVKTADENDFYDAISKAETMMYQKKSDESLSTKRQIIDNILDTLHKSFLFEKDHSENVAKYAMLIGEQLALSKEDLKKLRLAALLHDVGKIGVPNKLLSKEQQLSDEELSEVRKHTEKGMRILSAYPELSEFGRYALTHHEHIDGSGYPRGLVGKDIPLFSRIISIADAYDAMTSERVYRPVITKENALEELLKCSGKQFDEELVDIFIKVI